MAKEESKERLVWLPLEMERSLSCDGCCQETVNYFDVEAKINCQLSHSK